jgi:hypothetical protein
MRKDLGCSEEEQMVCLVKFAKETTRSTRIYNWLNLRQNPLVLCKIQQINKQLFIYIHN